MGIVVAPSLMKLWRLVMVKLAFPSVIFSVVFTGMAADNWAAERPAGWGGANAEGYVFEKDVTTKYGGTASGTIRSSVESPMNYATCVQRIRTDNYRSRRLRLSGYVKTNGADVACSLWMRIDGLDVLNLAFDNMQDRQIKGTNDWTRCEIVLDVPQNAESITLGARVSGKGQAWFDDLALETVSSEVNVTDMKPPTRQYDQPPLGNAPKELVNPDFEK
jgi:hypothetical protein